MLITVVPVALLVVDRDSQLSSASHRWRQGISERLRETCQEEEEEVRMELVG